MVKYPEYLDNNSFENIVKCIMALVIPMGNGIIYTCLFFLAEPPGFYIILRRMEDNYPHHKWIIVRGCTYLPIGFASALNLLHTIRIRRDSSIPSNHILKASAVVVAIVAQIVMGVVISTFCSKLFPPPMDFSVLLPLALQLIKSILMVTIVISHDGVRGHMSNLYFIRSFTTLLSMRQVRQISADKSNIELHGVTALK